MADVEKSFHFGERLKKLRLARGLSRRQLAVEINSTKNAICSFEKNKRFPSNRQVEFFIKFFAVKEEYLLTGKVNPLKKLKEKAALNPQQDKRTGPYIENLYHRVFETKDTNAYLEIQKKMKQLFEQDGYR